LIGAHYNKREIVSFTVSHQFSLITAIETRTDPAAIIAEDRTNSRNKPLFPVRDTVLAIVISRDNAMSKENIGNRQTEGP